MDWLIRHNQPAIYEITEYGIANVLLLCICGIDTPNERQITERRIIERQITERQIIECRISERRKFSNVELIKMTLKMDMDHDTDMDMDKVHVYVRVTVLVHL